MLLYHVSFGSGESLSGFETEEHRIFVPRVPVTCAPEEDQNTHRICLAPSVEECVQALASDHRDLRVGANLMVYKVNLDENDPNLLHPDEIAARVPDARENREHWYLAPLAMDGRLFVVKDFYAESDVAWSVVTIQDIRNKLQYFLQEDQKEVYLKAIADSESSCIAYNAIYHEASRQGKEYLADLLYDELKDVDYPWSSVWRVEYIDLIPVASPPGTDSQTGSGVTTKK